MKLLSSLFVAFLVSLTPCAGADGLIGNDFGIEGRYQVFEFSSQGLPLRPAGSIAGKHVAWPSAVLRDGTTYLYASVHDGDKWSSIHRWHSTATTAYVDDGAVLTANTSEPDGIGPATVAFDGTTYHLFYTVRSPVAGHVVNVATSSDGIAFTRLGAAYTVPTALIQGGGAVSYVCQDGETYRMLIEGYNFDLSTASAYMATSTSIDSGYGATKLLMRPDGFSTTMSGSAGNNFATTAAPLPIGIPLTVLSTGSADVYIAISNINGSAYFDRPLERAYANAAVASFSSKKVEASFIRKLPSGKWIAGMTGYGSFPAITAEYTTFASSPNIETDALTFIGNGFVLNPYFNSGKNSSENPEPIRSNMSCAN